MATGTVVGYLGPVPFTPTLMDTVFRGSQNVTYAIENIVEFKPNAEQAILYVLRLK